MAVVVEVLVVDDVPMSGLVLGLQPAGGGDLVPVRLRARAGYLQHDPAKLGGLSAGAVVHVQRCGRRRMIGRDARVWPRQASGGVLLLAHAAPAAAHGVPDDLSYDASPRAP